MKELFVNYSEDKKMIFLVEDGILTERYNNINRKNRIEGNIYIGKVRNVVSGLQAAFIDIGEKKNAFIRLKDILPQEDSTKEEEMTSKDIKNYIKSGMPLLVEVKRDSYNEKGARASTHINLPGRFSVLLPNSNFVTVSQKIENEKEKERLKKIASDFLPENTGAIIRTAAAYKEEEEIKKDLKNLMTKWNEIISTEISDSSIPKIIYRSKDLLEKTLIDLVDNDLKRIIVNSEETKKHIENILKELDSKNIEIVIKKDEDFNMYRLEKQIKISENRKIWLKNGGFITIDKTEALTAIDVNSGKYTGEKNLEETVLEVNKEAVVEIAKQIRLRDVGGIIVIDFIDLNNDKSREEILKIFSEELKKDRSKVQIEGFTKLDLLELTRKHICSN